MIDNPKNKLFLTLRDYSVSQEEFKLYHDQELDLLITKPIPDLGNLARYYESEDYISHTDGARSLFEKLYQLVKGITLRRKLHLINGLTNQKGVLVDFGAGTGDFALIAKEGGWNVIGFEPNSKARLLAENKGIQFIDTTASMDDHSVDVITLWHVLEHVPDINSQIKEFKRVLKPRGKIVVAVPNFKSYDAGYYGCYWAAYDVPRHLWHFSRSAVRQIFQKEEMKLVRTLPMVFDAFYVCLLSEKYKSGKMSFVKAFLLGLKSNWKALKTGEYSSQIYVIEKGND